MEESVMDTGKIASDLGAKKVVIVGTKNGPGSEPVAIYTNAFKGKSYFHIRVLYEDKDGTWCPGKGLSVAAENAKHLLKTLGEAAATY
jgi:hypothetical protein